MIGVSGGVGTPEEGEECAVDGCWSCGTDVVSRSSSSSISSGSKGVEYVCP